MTHPLFDPSARDYWSATGLTPRGPAEIPSRSTEFYHATKRNLDGESHVTTPLSRGQSSRTGSVDNAVWFSDHPSTTHGPNVYKVKPTGPFTDNADTPGELFGEYESEHPLRILSKVQFGGER